MIRTYKTWGIVVTLVLIIAVSLFTHYSTKFEIKAIQTGTKQVHQQVEALYEQLDNE